MGYRIYLRHDASVLWYFKTDTADLTTTVECSYKSLTNRVN